MDQYMSTIIVAIITGIFSIATLIIQKKQDKVIDKIDEHTMFIEKERSIKQKLDQKEKEMALLINEIMILILDTNLSILRNTGVAGSVINEEVFSASEQLKAKFNEAQEVTEGLRKEYQIVLDMTSQFQKEIENIRSGKS